VADALRVHSCGNVLGVVLNNKIQRLPVNKEYNFAIPIKPKTVSKECCSAYTR